MPLQLRAFQQRLVDAVLDNVAQGKRVTMAYCAPGSGKTLGSQYALNELHRAGHIDTAAVFSPRRNLCGQYELDWQRDGPKCPSPRIGPIVWSANQSPLVPGDAWGYTSTYAALTSAKRRPAGTPQRDLHLKWAREHRGRFALVGDEGQMLGVENELGGGTEAAAVFLEMSEFARHIIMKTGTPIRSDGADILFGVYSSLDENNMRYLLPDVFSSYREGVTECYLRPFHAEISKGELDWRWADGDREVLQLEKTRGGLLRFVTASGIWEPLVDDTVDRVRRTQELNPKFCGLVACATQEHVSEVAQYLRCKHPGVRYLVAKSNDGDEALSNLEAFKRGGYDLLLTVRMAYIGYSYQPISTVCVLTDYRDWGHLLQLVARGMRVWDGCPFDQQNIYIIAPHDPKMRKFLLWLRDESALGIKLREDGEPPPPGTPRLGWAESAYITETSALGIDPSGDLQPSQLTQFRDLVRRHNLGAAPETRLWSAFQEIQRSLGAAPTPPEPPPPVPSPPEPATVAPKTRREEAADWARRCKSATCQVVYRQGIGSKDPRFQKAVARLTAELSDYQRVSDTNHLTLEQWKERHRLIQRYLQEGTL